MKIYLLIIAMTSSVLISCGAERPFRRGDNCSTCGLKNITGFKSSGVKKVGDDGEEIEVADFKGFSEVVYPILENSCGGCHQGMAPKFSLDGKADKAYEITMQYVSAGSSNDSPLIDYATGKRHMGGKVFEADSEEIELIRQWIDNGLDNQ